jgi:hypothetical protein
LDKATPEAYPLVYSQPAAANGSILVLEATEVAELEEIRLLREVVNELASPTRFYFTLS